MAESRYAMRDLLVAMMCKACVDTALQVKAPRKRPTARVVSYRRSLDGVVLYTITVSDGLRRWDVERRFSQFGRLHNELCSALMVDPTMVKMPSKFTRTSEKGLQHRMDALSRYLKDLFKSSPSNLLSHNFASAFFHEDMGNICSEVPIPSSAFSAGPTPAEELAELFRAMNRPRTAAPALVKIQVPPSPLPVPSPPLEVPGSPCDGTNNGIHTTSSSSSLSTLTASPPPSPTRSTSPIYNVEDDEPVRTWIPGVSGLYNKWRDGEMRGIPGKQKNASSSGACSTASSESSSSSSSLAQEDCEHAVNEKQGLIIGDSKGGKEIPHISIADIAKADDNTTVSTGILNAVATYFTGMFSTRQTQATAAQAPIEPQVNETGTKEGRCAVIPSTCPSLLVGQLGSSTARHVPKVSIADIAKPPGGPSTATSRAIVLFTSGLWSRIRPANNLATLSPSKPRLPKQDIKMGISAVPASRRPTLVIGRPGSSNMRHVPDVSIADIAKTYEPSGAGITGFFSSNVVKPDQTTPTGSRRANGAAATASTAARTAAATSTPTGAGAYNPQIVCAAVRGSTSVNTSMFTQHTSYTIKMVSGVATWSVALRYSQFAALDMAVRKVCPKFDGVMPGKQSVNRLSTTLVAKRTDMFDSYIKAIVASPTAVQCPIVREVLQIDRYAPCMSERASVPVGLAADRGAADLRA